jgi:hypothetical protein
MKRLAILALSLTLSLALAACGAMGDLEPKAGNSLPPAPYGSSRQPTAERLLESEPQAVPERSVELRSESEEREDDPFDLPPEG